LKRVDGFEFSALGQEVYAMKDSYCIVTTTCGSLGEAHELAEMLVNRKLAACVQLVNITSVYRWGGELNKETELLLLIKTTQERYQQIEDAIRENHSYEVPEIMQIPVDGGFLPYLSWIDESTR